MFEFFKKKLKKISSKFKFSIGSKIKNLFSKKIDASLYEDLEKLFYESDLGVTTSMELVEKVRSLLKKDPTISTEKLLENIKQELKPYLKTPDESLPEKKPTIIMIVGVNGSGKTTSIAKLAHHYQKNGKKVLLAAADTYRAAAVEQLDTWAKRLNIEIVKSQRKSDPSSVAYDAIQAAIARDVDIVLIDTAGRLHTKTDLMQELDKMVRVTKKLIPEAPHETLLVLDATTGQNAIDQTEIFHKFTNLTGIILTKLDGTAKGGIIVAIEKRFKIPVKWIGTGEEIDDFSIFDPDWFIDELFSLKS